MSKWKLQVLLIPLDYTYVATAQVDTSVIKRFLHLTDPNAELALIREEIKAKYKKLYPNDEPLDIDRLQDGNNNDLDSDFFVNDVFSSGDILRIIVNNHFKPLTPFHHPHYPHFASAQATPLHLNTGDFSIGTVGTSRKRTQDYLENTSFYLPKRNNYGIKSPLQGSSPVALAPPPTAEDRTIPVKRNSSSPSAAGQRITSGMLIMPPHAQLDKPLKGRQPPAHANSDSSDYSEGDSARTTLGPATARPNNTIQLDNIVTSDDDSMIRAPSSKRTPLASSKKPAKKPEEQSLPREEIINVFKKGLKVPDKKFKPPPVHKPIPREFQNAPSQEIIKSLQINMVDAEPDLSLDRGSRVGAREAARIAASKISLSEASGSRQRSAVKPSPNPPVKLSNTPVAKPKATTSKPVQPVKPFTQTKPPASSTKKVVKQEPVQPVLKPRKVSQVIIKPKQKPKESIKSIDKPQPVRKLVAIAPKPEADEDSSQDEDDASDSKSLGKLEQFQERLTRFESDLVSLAAEHGTLRKMPPTFSSRVDEELNDIQGLILDPRLILVNRAEREYQYPPEIAEVRMSPTASGSDPRLDNDNTESKPANTVSQEEVPEIPVQHTSTESLNEHAAESQSSNEPKLDSPEKQPEIIDLTEDIPNETPASLHPTSIKATTSVNSSTPPVENVPPKFIVKLPSVVNLASNEASIPPAFRTVPVTKHASVPPEATEPMGNTPVKAKSIGPESEPVALKKLESITIPISVTTSAPVTVSIPETVSAPASAPVIESSPSSQSASQYKPAQPPSTTPVPVTEPVQPDKPVQPPTTDISNVSKVQPQSFYAGAKFFGATTTNKSPAFQISNGSDSLNGHTIQRDGSITANGKRPLDDSSSGESSDEEDDASSGSDEEEEHSKVKKPRLVASIPSIIRRSQSPVVRTPTPPSRILKTDEVKSPKAVPATVAAPERTHIVDIPKPTPQPVNTPSTTLKKPLLPSLSDLVNRGLPEVKDVNQAKGEAPKKPEVAKEEESSSSDDQSDSGSSSDSDSDDDESGKFITMKSTKTSPPKKKNLFMSLIRK